jgi:DNA-binding LacI/PurR family transcriptional regulator
MEKSSIKEVARLAGVSIATVSRVLNGNGRVKPHLRQRVLQAVGDLQYVPSGIARNMRNQSKRTIGLIISDIQNPFFTDIVRAIEETAYANQYTVLLGNTDGDEEKERLYLDILAIERIAGLILVPSSDDSAVYKFNRPLPLVFIDRVPPGARGDGAVLDNFQGGYEAARHLIELGHRRIGVVAMPADYAIGSERVRGLVSALEESGITVDEALIRSGDSLKARGGYAATKELLALDPPPTALFAVNNVRTMGMLQALLEAGVRVPQQMSVVGFDDSPWLTLLSPPLTTVGQPIYEIGAAAINLLLRRISEENGSPPTTVKLPPHLIVRASTAPLRTAP